jgi:excisionase family DNA binding protein
MLHTKPTLELLPEEVYELRQDVKTILKFLADHGNARQNGNQSDEFLTVSEAAIFLNLAKQSIYGLISRKQLPYIKKLKRVYFSKTELTKWLESGRQMTHQEIAANSRPILVRKGGAK